MTLGPIERIILSKAEPKRARDLARAAVFDRTGRVPKLDLLASRHIEGVGEEFIFGIPYFVTEKAAA